MASRELAIHGLAVHELKHDASAVAQCGSHVKILIVTRTNRSGFGVESKYQSWTVVVQAVQNLLDLRFDLLEGSFEILKAIATEIEHQTAELLIQLGEGAHTSNSD